MLALKPRGLLFPMGSLHLGASVMLLVGACRSWSPIGTADAAHDVDAGPDLRISPLDGNSDSQTIPPDGTPDLQLGPPDGNPDFAVDTTDANDDLQLSPPDGNPDFAVSPPDGNIDALLGPPDSSPDSQISTPDASGCNVACNPPHAVTNCATGVCTFVTCATGYTYCDGDPLDVNGCETDTTHDGNCGGCGISCASDACHVGLCQVVDGNGTCASLDRSACGTPLCALAGGADGGAAGGCALWKDTDGDGLSDIWETNGYIDVNCNGVNDGPSVDLPLPGANKTVPDIYVLYDWMDSTGPGPACNPDVGCPSGEQCNCPVSLPGCQWSWCSTTHVMCHPNQECPIDQVCLAHVCTGHSDNPEAEAPGSIQLVVDRFAARGFNLHVARGHARPHAHVVSFGRPPAAARAPMLPPG